MNIAVIGGSVTEGAGASSYEKSYAYKLEQYLKSKYEELNFINLGSGGTGSDFGVFRLKRDLGNFNPDVIFVDFAINDRIFQANDINIYFEGLIRECIKYTKKIIIIDFPTGMGDSCTSIHKKIAYFYNLPVIDVQDEVFRIIGNRQTTWSKISIDNLHPNDEGHNIYFEIIKKHLEKINFDEISAKFDYRTLSRYKFRNPNLINHDDKSVEYYGHWKEERFDLNNKFSLGAVSSNINDGIIFSFKGKYLAVLFLSSKESGILECTLDNQSFNVDLYSNTESQFVAQEISKNLSNTEHTLVMKICDRKNDCSLGNKVIVGGFLVD